VLPSRLILFDLTFSLVPGPLFLLASVAFMSILIADVDASSLGLGLCSLLCPS
jgi:hypothetical protein